MFKEWCIFFHDFTSSLTLTTEPYSLADPRSSLYNLPNSSPPVEDSDLETDDSSILEFPHELEINDD